VAINRSPEQATFLPDLLVGYGGRAGGARGGGAWTPTGAPPKTQVPPPRPSEAGLTRTHRRPIAGGHWRSGLQPDARARIVSKISSRTPHSAPCLLVRRHSERM
uniref:Uncharacterized protein n=1 Tax=Triticum urartu TaxID=4572 RepID=A0A8R7V7E8_TRIUA